MKYIELKEKISQELDVVSLIDCKYVPFVLQRKMVTDIKSVCLTYEKENNGLIKIDYVLKDLFKFLYVFVNYTNIEFEDLYLEDGKVNVPLAFEIYDFFAENKLIKVVYNQDVCKDFITLLDNEIEQEINIKNSVSFVLANVLNGIANRIPTEDSIKSLMNRFPTMLTSLNESLQKPKRRTTKKHEE